MKISALPTDHILVKAISNSEWDSCQYAIVFLSDIWKQEQLKRLDAVQPFSDDYTFQAINFYDSAVNFYQESEGGVYDVDKFLAGKDWAFVEISPEELDAQTRTENSLDCYRIAINGKGHAKYKAYGKHTDDEFWTEYFPLHEILGKQ